MTASKVENIYNEAFYRGHRTRCQTSARAIVPSIVKWLSPQSVVDFGCGDGTWLAEFGRNGVNSLTGLDGEYVKQGEMQIRHEQFIGCDLSLRQSLGRKFDLATCLEVAEHLTADGGKNLLNSIVEASDAVLFSAAVPGQPGANHVSLHWQSHWIGAFSDRGYRVLDVVRPMVWDNHEVSFWYAQNMFLFLREPVKAALVENIDAQADRYIPKDIVHPLLFMWAVDENAANQRRLAAREESFLELLGRLPRAAVRAIIRRVKRFRTQSPGRLPGMSRQ